MNQKELISKERERIKAIVNKKIDLIIYRREQMYKRNKRRRLIPLFDTLKADIAFLIDNPDYKPKKF